MCTCVFTPAHTRATHTPCNESQQHCLLLRGNVTLPGNVCRFPCGFLLLPTPLLVIYEQLTIWLLDSLGVSVSQTGPSVVVVWFFKAADGQILSLFSQLRPPTSQRVSWYLREALGAVRQLRSCNLNPHGRSGEASSEPTVSAVGTPAASSSVAGIQGGVSGGEDSFGFLNTVSHQKSHASKKFRAFLLPPDCEDQFTSSHLFIVCLSSRHTN